MLQFVQDNGKIQLSFVLMGADMCGGILKFQNYQGEKNNC